MSDLFEGLSVLGEGGIGLFDRGLRLFGLLRLLERLLCGRHVFFRGVVYFRREVLEGFTRALVIEPLLVAGRAIHIGGGVLGVLLHRFLVDACQCQLGILRCRFRDFGHGLGAFGGGAGGGIRLLRRFNGLGRGLEC